MLQRLLIFRSAVFFALAAALLGGNSRLAQAGEKKLPMRVDFNFHIRPILADRCYACHGPDHENRQADLRLDTPEGAFAKSEYGEAPLIVKPGDPSQSELFQRITSQDDGVRMPPPDSHLTVSSTEVALIKRWIEQGAHWKEHWSFLPIDPADPPRVTDENWDKSPIDRFVFAKLREKGLSPNKRASSERLARRLYFDLTGLPPTVSEVDAFLADDSPEAYERLVDRLLASPQYGERMAVDWLDVARYADTYGYQADVYRDVWPYRDWVIKAFNENLPYDRFVTWQLAGDLLPKATHEQILATAFNRLHRQTNEGGSIEEEFRVEYVIDRTDTFGLAFLGLSVGCARCHDHKFDPISQKEYYQLSAFFDNIDESGLYSHYTKSTPTPALLQATDEQQAELEKLGEKLQQAERELAAVAESPAEQAAFERWGVSVAKQESVGTPIPGIQGAFSFDGVEKDIVPNRADQQTSGRLFDSPKLADGRVGKGLQLSGDNGFATRAGGDFTRHDPFTISMWIKSPAEFERAVVLHRSKSWTDAGSRGYQWLIEGGKLSASLIHFWPGNAIRIRTKEKLPTNKWLQISITYDGSSRAEGLKLYVNGERVDCETVRDKLTKTIGYGVAKADEKAVLNGAHSLTVGVRNRDRGFKGGAVDELKIFDRELTRIEVAQLHEDDTNQQTGLPDAPSLFEYYLANQSDAYRVKLAALHELREQRGNLLDRISEIMVMKEMDKPRPSYVLERGVYDARGEQVEPGVPRKLLPMDPALPKNRLGLARWLTDPNNPLPARVAVNRFWQAMLGRGLVATQEDFGSQGQLPTHPELLDWLARSFVESGWDVKQLVKRIVTSQTYQQSSDIAPELRANDPTNDALARGPRYRLSAEMIRDAALQAGGLLVEKVGGPPVRPYQPPGLWKETGSLTYNRQVGEGSHRRSLYTIWKRTSPPPAMMTLDAAKRDVCLVRRQTTSTPLQALVLLNDPQYVEAARALATKALTEDPLSAEGQPRKQIDYLFRTLTARRPTAEEAEVLIAMYTEQRKYFQEAQSAAKEFLAIGDFEADEKLDQTELAAMSVVASAVMNFDEFAILR